MNNQEIWQQIPEFEGLYEININTFQVKSLSRKVKCLGQSKKYYDRYTGERKIKNTISKRGYLRVSLCKNGKHKNCSVHRLLAKICIPNPENKMTINHKDGNKLNNCISNLEWNTQLENNQHAIKIGLTNNVGEKNSDRIYLEILKKLEKSEKIMFRLKLQGLS